MGGDCDGVLDLGFNNMLGQKGRLVRFGGEFGFWWWLCKKLGFGLEVVSVFLRY